MAVMRKAQLRILQTDILIENAFPIVVVWVVTSYSLVGGY
jgi:hypothetical protein